MNEANTVGVRFLAALRHAEADPDQQRNASLLCELCVRLLSVDRAAIMVCTGDDDWEMLGASDPVAVGWSQVQVAAGEGPGPEAYRLDAPVLVPDFGGALAGGRWPLLAASGQGRREGAVFAFPLHRGAIRVGTLDLYTDAPAALTRAEFAAAIQVADVLTVVLLAALRSPDPELLDATGVSPIEALAALGNGTALGPWWEAAVSTREIHQATGMVAVQLSVDIADAYARLVAHALIGGQPIAQVAADVVARRLRFEPGDDSAPGRSRP
ncbi:GAF and ANTAR domain-containing protein [Nocardia blacklockiae]|uniref:GAF and ANTAR domain-containing protein n=1 Tax=Nocardia blacklockiae TaxID=480036 RepID=UPI001895283B|nr:GAF and ANTAR domain-containing protein [Nocardia blacklockiae]MBF6173750.1 ANTAR domain-containing protein [Nocardia blacklockiae]